MSLVSMHLLEAILRLCATAAPNPWFPRDYAKTAGVSLQQLSQLLELLYLDGLVRKAPGTAGAETGFLLTVEGQRVLEDPEALERLRNGEPLVPGDRGATVRRLLGRPVRPLVTWLLLAANFLVFGYGAYLAFTRQPPIKAYLDLLPTNNAGVSYITHQIGSLHGSDLLRGEWWRLMSCCFVHFGLLHILMNMYGLYAVGRTVETMWGHGWFLVLYLLSGLGGSCLGIAYQPGANNAGASGALCGLVGAIAVWVLLNGRFLPRALASRWRSGLLTTFVLMVFISLFPNVSAAAHLGGALAGGAAALLLNFHRFSPAPWRWLALLGLAAIPWACFAALERARATSNDWHQVEEMDFEQCFLTPGSPTNLRKIMYSANWFYQNNVRPLLDQRPERRDPEALERGLSSLDEQGQALHDLEKTLAQTGPYRDAEVEEARQAGLAYVRARARLLELADRCLREGEQWTAEEEKALKEQIATLAQARRAWEELLKK